MGRWSKLVVANSGHKILIVSRESPESYGPAGERIRHMALASKSVFGKTIVLVLGRSPKRATKKLDSTVLLHKVKLTRELPYPITGYFDPLKFILLFVHGFFLCLRYKPECILASMPPSEVGVSAWLVSKLLGINLIVDLRDDWELAQERELSNYFPKEFFKPLFWLATRVYSCATAILVSTQTIAERVKRRGIETPTVLASNGADTSIFFQRGGNYRKKMRIKHDLPQNKVIILYCGSLTRYYRLDRVLSFVSSLPDHIRRQVFLVFYLHNGVEKVREMKEELRMSDDLVEVREAVPRVVLAEVMAACDVGLVPFDDEPYLLCARSAKLYEYLSAGLYVICNGPKGGELERFFSVNQRLGTFSLPYRKDLSSVFSPIIKDRECMFDDNNRILRHDFIRENYERKTIMTKAMKAIARFLFISTSAQDAVLPEVVM